MRAVVVDGFDLAPVVRDFDDPLAGPGEVVVDIAAIDVNFPDILYVEGKYQALPPLPFVPGLAAAGHIAATGSGVDADRIGQRVLVIPDHGTYAEKVAAPAQYCFPLPDDMPFETAAAFGLVYQTAWFALRARGGFEPGQNVMVLGSSGGIGMAAVQLAKALGASRVIATTRGADGVEIARASGADHVIDVAGGDLRELLKREVGQATEGAGVDVVIDPVGGDLAIAAIRVMAWSGTFVTVGFASGSIPQIPAGLLLVKNVAAAGIQWTDYRDRRIGDVAAAQAEMFSLWRAGKLDPRVSRTMPMQDFAKALAVLREGNGRGKIVLTVGASAA